MTEPKQGWGYLHNHAIWHYFVANWSLCGRWSWPVGYLEGEPEFNTCATCRRKRAQPRMEMPE